MVLPPLGEKSMDIRQINYFVAVAQNGSFSKAAEMLSLSQPTLSLAVKKLEEELGVKLFYSFNKRQELTDEGAALLESSRHLLDAYQQTLEHVKSSRKSRSGSFILGLSPLFGACFFGDLIPKFNQEYPNIQITMIEDGAYKIDERIANGQVDLAVTLKTDRLSTFSNCHFTTQRNVVLLHKSHPLAGEKSLTVAQLREEPFAIFSQDFILHRQILPQCGLPAQIRAAEQSVGLHGGAGGQKPRGVHPAQACAGQAPGPQCGLYPPDRQHEILGHCPGVEQRPVYAQCLPVVFGLCP